MITRKVSLYFPKCETEKPIVSDLIRNFDLTVNIFRAKVTPEEEGYMVLDVTGSEPQIDKGMAYIRSLDVGVDITQSGLRRIDEKCTSCGACLTHCPTGALSVPDRSTMEVTFQTDKCVECLSCLDVCPFQACVSLI